MADVQVLLRQITGLNSDQARDRLPPGAVWQLQDVIPSVEAGARIRGRWTFQSNALPNAIDGMIYAPFASGSRLLVVNGSNLAYVPTPVVDHPSETSVGTVQSTLQNPVFHRDRVIIPASNGTLAAKFVTWNGATYTITDAPASALTGRYATVWKDRVVLANSNAQPQQVAYSKPGDPTIAWDNLSLINTAYPITGLAQLATLVLAFHESSVERLRGTTPPDSSLSNPVGDLILDTLFDRAGCYDAHSIAYWQNNVWFADERGIWVTDGATVRNVTQQAGIQRLWQSTFNAGTGTPLWISGCIAQGYYICTLAPNGAPAVTFLIDIQTRRAFTFKNITSKSFAVSSGTTERLYGTDNATKKVIDLSACFKPDSSVLQIDDNGVSVLPKIGTGWSMLSRTPGFKRVIDLLVGYLAVNNSSGNLWQVSIVEDPGASEFVLGYFPVNLRYERRKMPVGRRLPGIAFLLEQVTPTFDTRFYDLSVRAYPEEPSRVGGFEGGG